jgi:hypothetical protein
MDKAFLKPGSCKTPQNQQKEKGDETKKEKGVENQP